MSDWYFDELMDFGDAWAQMREAMKEQVKYLLDHAAHLLGHENDDTFDHARIDPVVIRDAYALLHGVADEVTEVLEAYLNSETARKRM